MLVHGHIRLLCTWFGKCSFAHRRIANCLQSESERQLIPRAELIRASREGAVLESAVHYLGL